MCEHGDGSQGPGGINVTQGCKPCDTISERSREAVRDKQLPGFTPVWHMHLPHDADS